MGNGIKTPNGITADTYKRLAMDAGVVYQDYGLPGQKILGATRGGNNFGVEDEIREMLVDGAPGPVRGSQRRTKSTPKITLNLIEFTTDNVKLLLPGAESTAGVGGDVITRSRQISEGDYVDNITLVVAKNGTEDLIALKVNNALALNGLDFAAAEDDETVLAFEFTGHYDPANLAQEPWEVFNPDEVATVTHTLTYTAGANGAVVGTSPQTVYDGEDGTEVGAIADDLYEFIDWSDASTDNPRQDLAVSGDITVTANFALI
jgi:hypothetical protein